MKAPNFRRIKPKNCMTCGSLIQKDGLGITGQPAAGMFELRCANFCFQLAPMGYLPNYEVEKWICDCHWDRNEEAND